MYKETELSYRKSAVSGASPIGLVIALYDTLSGNLRRAAAAIRHGDIQKRCAELNHAVLVIGQLESWVDRSSNEPLADCLIAFYENLRRKMMQASLEQSAEILESQLELILQVRSAWQQRDAAAQMANPVPTLPTVAPVAGFVRRDWGNAGSQQRVAFSQTA